MSATTLWHLTLALAVSLQVGTAATLQAPPQGGRATGPVERISPIDHLSAARKALEAVARESLTPDAATRVTDIKQLVAALEQSYLSHGTTTISKEETPSGSTRVKIVQKGTWSSRIGDIDARLGRLIDSPSPIATVAQRDTVVKGQLRDARKHLTSFAVAASGTGGPPVRKPQKP